MGRDTNSESESVLSESENGVRNADTLFEFKTEEKRHKCTYPGCEAMFCRPSRLARHIRSHTGERNFKCTVPNCDKAYTNACHLKRHMKTHSDIKVAYKCTECTLLLSNQDNLKRHYKTMHTDNGKLKCKRCNETFTKKYHLAMHMATHAPELHKCEKCNKSFTNNVQFKRHAATHKGGNKKYPCTTAGCSEVFDKWLQLCAHLKTQHVTEQICKICSKVFVCKRHLRVHSKVHMENRPVIPCPYEKCPRVYYFKNNLQYHIRIYHMEQKFECDICKIKLSSKARIAEHIQNLHMSENRIKKQKKLRRKKRKDAGRPKKSMACKLIGLDLPPRVEKVILERKDDFCLEEYAKALDIESF